MRRWITDWIRAVRDLLLPRCGCAFCGQLLAAPEDMLCPACIKALAASRLGYQPCRHCATFVPLGVEVCRSCGAARHDAAHRDACRHETARSDSWLDKSRAAYPYEGVIKDRIRQLKYHRGVWLANPLGQLMLETTLSAGLGQADLVIPVPLHPLRQQQRGYNQAEKLARIVAQSLGLPLDTRTLIRCRNTPSQTSLKRSERLRNPENAFALTQTEAITGKRILLVDDIYTTGATVAACARVLRQGGATSVCAILCAAGKQQNIAK